MEPPLSDGSNGRRYRRCKASPQRRVDAEGDELGDDSGHQGPEHLAQRHSQGIAQIKDVK